MTEAFSPLVLREARGEVEQNLLNVGEFFRTRANLTNSRNWRMCGLMRFS